MNLTTQYHLQTFQSLPQTNPPSEPLPQLLSQITLHTLLGLRQLLLLYPINIIVLLSVLYWCVWGLLRWCGFGAGVKRVVYAGGVHVQMHDLHVRGLKKDVRQLQNQVSSFSRRMEARRKEREEAGITNQQGPQSVKNLYSQTNQILKSLLEESQQVRQVSKESIKQIKLSQSKFMEKLKKYQRM